MQRHDARAPRPIYGGRNPRELPAYTPGEAARYLRIPFRTIHNWSFGFTYRAAGQSVQAKPLIQAADADQSLLSFVNLAELHVLDALRNYHGIPPKKLRRLIDYIARQFNTPHPLIDEKMFTNDVSVFVERAGQLIDVTKEGQIALRQIIEAHIHRIEQDVDGLAMRLFPFVRRKPAPEDPPREEPKVISLDPRVQFGRPVIAGTSIPTTEIAERFKAGDSFEELAEDYGRPPAEIEEAIRCELTLDSAA